MNNLSNLATVVVTVINFKQDKEVCKPVFEASGEAGFNKFVAWYEENTPLFHHAIIEGFELNNSNPIARKVVTNY